jgi:hypothetical protein
MPDLSKVRKFVVASSGLTVLLAGSFGLDTVAGADDQIVQSFDSLVGLLTAFGVYKVPNA